MRCLFSYPGVMDHAQHAALALKEADALQAFVTNYAYVENGIVDHLCRLAPGGLRDRLRRELSRRAVFPELQDSLITLPAWEVARTAAAKLGAGPILTDRVWDAAAKAFDRKVASMVERADAVVAFEYTALASFERAKAAGKACILHLPSLDSLAFETLQSREKAAWPELRGPADAYFEAKFAKRYARRCAEIALADVIIANSTLTKRSHVEAGADPDKVFVVPLGVPEPIEAPQPHPLDRPLQVMWSGAFTLRKGAHYLLDAWSLLAPAGRAELTVYGEIHMPERLRAQASSDVRFLGSMPRAAVLDAYAAADVMVFPTLSDGFGLSIGEALSRGTPVITTDEAGAADLVEHGVNGLIVPAADAQALSKALQWCLHNREALHQMRARALETAKAHEWRDYRRAVTVATDAGLQRAGFGALRAVA